MKTVPPLFGSSCPQSEVKVFHKLEQFGNFSANTSAYHSLLLPTHSNKRIGEADFVILGPEGIFVLEVKATGTCHEGVWDYGYRDGSKKGSPASQANTALFAILDYLEKNSGISNLKQKLTYGYGVIFTSCDISPTIEMPQEVLLTQQGLHLFDKWLANLVKYWRGKKHSSQTLLPAELQTLHSCLRQNYELPLKATIQGIKDKVWEFTESQFLFLDTIIANPRVLCTGGAGTGKTFMAEELAVRFSDKGEKVLLVCKSPWLASFLSSRIDYPRVLVTSLTQLQQKVAVSGISKFDKLLVDEGQDMMSFEAFELIEPFLNGGFEEGNWCIFHDINNQSGFWSEYHQDAMEYLKSFSPATVRLTKNCRNTLEILRTIQKKTGFDTGIEGVGSGPEVEWRSYNETNRSEARALVEIMKEVRDEGLKGQTVILSPKGSEASCIQDLNSRALKDIDLMDAYSTSMSLSNNFRYCQIKDFKGLEADIIILIDLSVDAFNLNSPDIAQTYIGMSRARSKLYIVFKETNSS